MSFLYALALRVGALVPALFFSEVAKCLKWNIGCRYIEMMNSWILAENW